MCTVSSPVESTEDEMQRNARHHKHRLRGLENTRWLSKVVHLFGIPVRDLKVRVLILKISSVRVRV